MTREEAKNQLKDAKDGYKEYLTDEALDIAMRDIEAMDKIEHFIQHLGIQEPVLTFRELCIYKRLKEICGL